MASGFLRRRPGSSAVQRRAHHRQVAADGPIERVVGDITVVKRVGQDHPRGAGGELGEVLVLGGTTGSIAVTRVHHRSRPRWRKLGVCRGVWDTQVGSWIPKRSVRSKQRRWAAAVASGE